MDPKKSLHINIKYYFTMKPLLPLLILALATTNLSAQSNKMDKKINELIASQNYIELNQQYPNIKDKLSEMMRLKTEAILGSKFNRYEESCHAISALLNDHATELQTEDFSTLYSTLINNLSALGDYAQVKEVMQTIAPDDKEALNYFTMRENAPKFEIIFPETDTELPFTIQNIGAGQHIMIEGEINGKKENYIFDTGCNEFNFVSIAFAEAHNFTFIFDSLHTTGSTGGDGYCKVAVAPELKLGDIVLKNSLFLVYDDLMLPDSISLDPVLGTTVQRALGEVHIVNSEQKMVIPRKNTEIPSCGQNLFLEGSYYLSLQVNGKRTAMLFDTGSSNTSLNDNYYNQHKKKTHATGTKGEATIGGFGKYSTYHVYTLPKVAFEVCNNSVTLNEIDVEVFRNSELPYVMGTVGTDFILAYSKVIINFNDMFVIAE